MSIKRCTLKKSHRNRVAGSPVTVPPPGDYEPLSTKMTLQDYLLEDLRRNPSDDVWKHLCDYVWSRYPNLKSADDINSMAARLAKGVI